MACCGDGGDSSSTPKSGSGPSNGKCKRVCSLLFSTIGLGIVIGVYLFIGGLIFKTLDSQSKIKLNSDVMKLEEKYVSQLWDLSRNPVDSSNSAEWMDWVAKSTSLLQNYRYEIARAISNGYAGEEFKINEQPTLSRYVFYSFTIITTIGRSGYTPITPWSKIVTVLYAILGIPLTFMFLANIGECLARLLICISWKVCRSKKETSEIDKDEEDYDEYGEDEDDDNDNPKKSTLDRKQAKKGARLIRKPVTLQDKLRIIGIAIVCLILLILYLIMGTIFLSLWEEWNLIDTAFYIFSFITTIGDTSNQPMLKLVNDRTKFIAFSFYIFIGMILLSLLINIIRHKLNRRRRMC